jgi:hypothetical protein
MVSGPFRRARVALVSLLLSGPAAVAQAPAPGGPTAQPTSAADHARELAFTYLDRWSAPNRVALATAPSFYGPTVRFHGRTRTLRSVLDEKRRFAERWPDRDYRYRRETTLVDCSDAGARCTFRSTFDFAAGNARRGRRSRGVGEHELVISLEGARPVIASETSRVLRRGARQRRSA